MSARMTARGSAPRPRAAGWSHPRGRSIPFLLLLLLSATPTSPLEAQDRGLRKWLFGALGAALVGVPASFAEEQDIFCGSRSCMVPLGALLGGTAGFLLGREMDRKAARASAAGPALRLDSRRVELEFAPEGIALFEGGAVIIGREGLAVVSQAGELRPVAGAVRGVRAVAAMPRHDALVAATAAGLFVFPLAEGEREGRQLEREAVGLALPLGPSALLLANGGVWRRVRLSGEGAEVSLTEETRAEAEGGAAVAAANAPYAGVVWTLSGDRLVARSQAALAEIGSIRLPALGRSLSLDGSRALVAGGGEGLFLVDVGAPESPRLLARLRGLDFAFDAVLVGEQAYVAAGGLGLVVLDISDPEDPVVTGVARDLGFVAQVERDPSGRLWALDRGSARLHVVEPR